MDVLNSFLKVFILFFCDLSVQKSHIFMLLYKVIQKYLHYKT
jgi:hypothetical protein